MVSHSHVSGPYFFMVFEEMVKVHSNEKHMIKPSSWQIVCQEPLELEASFTVLFSIVTHCKQTIFHDHL